MKRTIIICKACGVEFSKTNSVIRRMIKLGKNAPMFCSRSCHINHAKSNIIEFNCHLCNKKSIKTEKEYNKAKLHFCERKCSLTWQNTYGSKRKKEGSCKLCNLAINSSRVYCNNCYTSIVKNGLLSQRRVKIKKTCSCGAEKENGKCLPCMIKLREEIVNLPMSHFVYENGERSNQYNLIRSHARQVVKERKRECWCCKFEKCLDVCHIKAVNKFEKTAILKEVNSEENLIILCKNCHWQFDHDKKFRTDLMQRKGNDPNFSKI